jgi:hypothetical protein
MNFYLIVGVIRGKGRGSEVVLKVFAGFLDGEREAVLCEGLESLLRFLLCVRSIILEPS